MSVLPQTDALSPPRPTLAPSIDGPTLTPGEQLRRYREAAGLSREDLALGIFTEPELISARSRAEWVGLIENGVAPVSPEFHAELLALVARIGSALAERPTRPAAQAAA